MSVSFENCVNSRWSPDGRELFLECVSDQGMRVLVAPVEPGPSLRLGDPKVLIEGAFAGSTDAGSSFSLSADGTRLLLARRDAEFRRARHLVVVQDWFTEVARLTAR